MSGEAQLLDVFRASLDSVHGARAVERSLRERDPGPGPYVVLGAGKAACAMAAGALAALGDRVRGGLVVTKEGHGAPIAPIEVREAGHPLPDLRGVKAAEAALRLAAAEPPGATEGSALLVLISGGASALWPAPVEGVSLADKRTVTDALLRAGAEIHELNAVRKHLSRIKGGGLARAAAGRRAIALLISDVRGDALDTIGSGPTAPDPTTFGDALRALRERLSPGEVPQAVRDHLEAGAAGRVPESPGPGDPIFERVEHRLVATLDDALSAAARAARELGLEPLELGASLRGEARECASTLARLAREAGRDGGDRLLIAGGEPVVQVRGDGVGGRAQEMALAFALEVAGDPDVTGLFAGTDGTDGPTDAAGAIVDGRTVERARERGRDASAALERNDAYPLLQAAGALLITGPTSTNVTDLALIRVRSVPPGERTMG